MLSAPQAMPALIELSLLAGLTAPNAHASTAAEHIH